MTSANYTLILGELLEEEPESPSLPSLPSLMSFEPAEQISILRKLYYRERVKENRCNSLYYLFNIGKIVLGNDLSLKESKLTHHYYRGCKRLYLLFERDESQIMRTKTMTFKDLIRLKKREYATLMV